MDLRRREGPDGVNVENNDERKLPQIELNSLYAVSGGKLQVGRAGQ